MILDADAKRKENLIMDTTILIIEDNPTTHKMFRTALEAEGYHVVGAFDGETALKVLDAVEPNLILQDLLLPDMQHAELNQKLREHKHGAQIPILALSGFLNKPDESQFQDAYTAFLIKPVEITRLTEIVKSFLPQTEPIKKEKVGHRILIVDDNRTQLKLLQLHLNHQGFIVETAVDGLDALQKLKTYPADGIVSDVLMPNVDGFELCLEIRRLPQFHHVPVILLTSQYLEESDKELAKKVGADHYVTRSHDAEKVITILKECLNKKEDAVFTTSEPVALFKEEHTHRLIRQLERQIEANAGLVQRCALQFAHLTMFSEITEAITHSMGIEKSLENLLATCLDAAGISYGAFYLLANDGAMVLKQTIGFNEATTNKLTQFLESKNTLAEIMSKRDVMLLTDFAISDKEELTSVLLAPLVSNAECLGVLLLGSKVAEINRIDSFAFARNLATQITQAVVLARAFERVFYSEQRYRGLMDNASCGIFIFDQQGKLLEVNKQGEKLFDCTKEEILNQDLLSFIPDADKPLAIAALRNLKEGRMAGPSEIRIRQRTGSERVVEYSGVAIKTANENILMIVTNDISDRVELKAQARMNDRLAIVGTLAAGVAHEINNPIAWVMNNLVFIKNNMNIIKKRAASIRELLPELDIFEMDEMINESVHGVERIRDIVKNLKGFSRRDAADMMLVNIHEILNVVVSMASVEFKYRARLEKNYGNNIPTIMTNAGKLQQVFLNLIINASQAIQEGNISKNSITIKTELEDRFIRVDISDTGHGIAAETLPYIFDPFFTTKPMGHGTGLGLSICREIISQLNGKVSVKSVVNQGSTFSVYVPINTDATEATTMPIQSDRKRILIVDDEPFLLKSLSNTLKHHYHVTTALGGRIALDLLAQHKGRFDSIICDLQMPDLDGADFYKQVVELYNWLEKRVIFITGGSYTPKLNEFLAGIGQSVLEKPFTQEELLEALEKMQ